MKTKIIALITLIIIITSPAYAQQNYFGKNKIELHNGYYFLLPDSYVPTSAEGALGFPNSVVKAYKNHNAAIIMFMSAPIPESDETLKDMGIEGIMQKQMEPIMDIQLIRTIEMNGRDTLFIRGRSKQQTELHSYNLFGKGDGSRTKIHMEMIGYIVKQGNYFYMTFCSSSPQQFPENYRDFMEIQNSFSNKPLY